MNNDITFVEYFRNWIDTYKKGAVREVTYNKYITSLKRLEEIIHDMKLSDMNRVTYQSILNTYAEAHEKVTVMDFHHHLKSVLLDARDEGYLNYDPTRRAVIKGKIPNKKKDKYLSQFELDSLLRKLELSETPSQDWLILVLAKTGARFSEAIALTPQDFDFEKQKITINKTWDYKQNGGFVPTKNQSSVRTIQMDWHLAMQMHMLVANLPPDKPVFSKIFVNGKCFNSTTNNRLKALCKKAEVPVITVHGLRHTHASVLLGAGVSIASVSQRLGHSNMATTQKVYLHIIKELEIKDNGLIMTALTGLGG